MGMIAKTDSVFEKTSCPVGEPDRFSYGKRAEEYDRIKHTL